MSKPSASPDRAAAGGSARGALLFVLLLVSQAAAHWAVMTARVSAETGAGVMLVLLAASLAWVLLPRRAGAQGWLAALLVTAIGILAWQAFPQQRTLAYLLPHVGVCSLLLALFARTLVPGRQALVTRLALQVHGTLPDSILRYSRAVTWAWCVFFAVMILTSITLFAFAPLAVWSWFANVLNLPLVLLMFLGEYAYRLWRHRDFSHASLMDGIRAFRKLRAGGSSLRAH